MYDNIGKKIMGLAKAVFWIEAIAFVILGIVVCAITATPAGLIIAVPGPFLTWMFSWILYGFGELIYKTSAIADIVTNKYSKAKEDHFLPNPEETAHIIGETKYSGIGKCEICGKREVLYTGKLKDNRGETYRLMCYGCVQKYSKKQ